jgi:predicted branched-subunit amino acid permease
MLKRLPWYFMLLAVAVAGVICYAGVSPIWFILAGALAGVVLTWYEKPRPDGKGGAE